MSESQSPAPEEHELEIHDSTHLEDEDSGGISTDTSGSLPGSPGPEEDGDVVTVCRWDGCNQDMRTLDALVRHVHECPFPFISSADHLKFTSAPGDLDTRVNGKIVRGVASLRLLGSL